MAESEKNLLKKTIESEFINSGGFSINNDSTSSLINSSEHKNAENDISTNDLMMLRQSIEVETEEI